MILFDCHHPAELPPDEKDRQRAVDASRALHHRCDPALHAVARAATELFATPMAAITIIDHDSQYLIAAVGLDAVRTSRAISFCAHAILKPAEMMVVPDARRDPRFAANLTVLFAPHIRFYAGVPLRDRRGFPLGALCILDTHPRAVPPQIDRLTLLAREAERLIARWEIAG